MRQKILVASRALLLLILYSRATEQARNQYIIGYLSNNKPPGDEAVFRNIEIKMARAGLEVMHRKGYFQYP